jgi:hypothetical protein
VNNNTAMLEGICLDLFNQKLFGCGGTREILNKLSVNKLGNISICETLLLRVPCSPCFYLWRRAPQQMLRTHRSLKSYYDEDEEKDDQFFFNFSK